jgi:DNA-binding response OmpR family regulator/HPt (histidine-containing phosphotransfer) domain-containing protein
MRILVVEDDALVAQALTKILTQQNYAVEVATDGQAGWDLVETYEYDLVLLDVMLPKLDGIALCRRMRSHNYAMPILLLTGQDSGHDKAIGLDAGADDYVVKPFDVEELVARVRALLRRAGTISQPILTWGELQLDPTTCQVTWQSQLLSLTSKEYALLELFLRNSRRVFSCGMILEHLWSYETMPGEEAVRTHIKCLRQKFKAAGIPADVIETVYGIGYRLKPLETNGKNGTAHRKAATSGKSSGSPQMQPAQTPQAARSPHSPDVQEQTLAAIAQVWQRFKGRVQEQVAVVEQAMLALETGDLPPDLKQQAYREAHTLAGALGTFGLAAGSQVAKAIEQELKADQPLTPDAIHQLREQISQLQHIINQDPAQASNGHASPTNDIPPTDAPLIAARRDPVVTHATHEQLPVLLVIDRDRHLIDELTNELKTVAPLQRFRVVATTDMDIVKEHLERDRPSVVLLDPTCTSSAAKLELLTTCKQQTPPIPVLVLSTQDQLSERLEMARLGAQAFLHKPLPAAQILATITQCHQIDRVDATLLIVDDDPQTLALLQVLLEPWGLKVITLDNPQQFWVTLEAVAPDLLILDVEMPGINGIELCQIVRSDPHWRSLPILFLTAHTDAVIVNQVFATGADDFVGKPIISPDLITRIFNRLDRTVRQAGK